MVPSCAVRELAIAFDFIEEENREFSRLALWTVYGSIPVVRISLLEYSKIHEKALKFESLEAFKMYYVMRASAPSLHRESTDALIY